MFIKIRTTSPNMTSCNRYYDRELDRFTQDSISKISDLLNGGNSYEDHLFSIEYVIAGWTQDWHYLGGKLEFDRGHVERLLKKLKKAKIIDLDTLQGISMWAMSRALISEAHQWNQKRRKHHLLISSPANQGAPWRVEYKKLAWHVHHDEVPNKVPQALAEKTASFIQQAERAIKQLQWTRKEAQALYAVSEHIYEEWLRFFMAYGEVSINECSVATMIKSFNTCLDYDYFNNGGKQQFEIRFLEAYYLYAYAKHCELKDGILQG